MVVFRRILAVIAMVVCTGVLLVCLAGVVGVWIVRVPMTNGAVALLTSAQFTLQKVEVSAGQISEGLVEIQGLTRKVDDAVSGANSAAGVLKQIGPVGEALAALTDGVQQLDGRISEIRISARQIQSQAGALASQVDIISQRISAWISAAAILITLALLWIGLGQVSLFMHALAWLKTAPAGTAVQPTAGGLPDDAMEDSSAQPGELPH